MLSSPRAAKFQLVTTWAIFDNECSGELDAKMDELKVYAKHVPPDEHWKNAACALFERVQGKYKIIGKNTRLLTGI